MTSSPASSTEDQCFDPVSTGANLNQSNNTTLEREKDEEDEDEEGDVDFNPFMKEALSVEASSSLSSEIEEFDADVVDSGGKSSPIVTDVLIKGHDNLQDYGDGDTEHDEEVVMQAAESSAGAFTKSSERISPIRCNKRQLSVIRESDKTTVIEKGTASSMAKNTVNDVTLEDVSSASQSNKLILDVNDDDAICRRTRARYSLASFTLDELETFLQETDDEDDFHNVDDEEEYRKFLAAVLQGGDAISDARHENENVDEEDEDNDADFDLELEEALESDVDENVQGSTRELESEPVRRRPETRQKKRQKTNLRHKGKAPGQLNRPLRPILPHTPIAPLPSPNARTYMLNKTSSCLPSSAKDGYISIFTPEQVGQLHCLIYEHVQLLVQVFSLSVLEPSRQHIATQVQGLLSEMLQKRDQGLASRRVPHPSFCFDPPHIRSTVPLELPEHLATESTSKSSSFDARGVYYSGKGMMPSDANLYQGVYSGMTGDVQPVKAFFWVPFISGPVLSVIDVVPLDLVGSYMDDVSIAVREHQRRQLADTLDANVDKECLFPYESFHSSAEPNNVSSAPIPVPTSANDHKPKKTTAAALVERSKKQSIAPVPKQIAKLALRFFPLFNPAVFPHKPPPASVANRVLFTDSEDVLLARGLMEYNTNWKEIQKHFLPCKSMHQIFVRQKNRSCSRAPENPIKAVRRMKNSPLTPEEQARIEEGLKVYKFDWISVWKYMVPYRDPSLLARQWRTAIGTQKSYKKDEARKAKRRLYELGRRKSPGMRSHTISIIQNVQRRDETREGWSTEEEVNVVPGSPLSSGTGALRYEISSDKENCDNDNAGENNSGDDGLTNEDEAFVHEAFLADWPPSSISSELPVSNLEENQPIESFVQEGSHARDLTNNSCLVKFHPQYGNRFLGHSQHFQHPNFSSHSTHLASSNNARSSAPKFIRAYRARRFDRPRLVKLAPGLPPVNLPPTVRVMSQSAFTKYRDDTSAKISTQGPSGPAKQNVALRSPHVMKSGVDHSSKGVPDKINPLKCGTGRVDKCHSVEKEDDSDLHMHPLLFQASEDGSLPYYPLNGSAGSSSSFNFFPNNHTQLNLNPFHYSQQAKHTLNFFSNSLKSKALNSSSSVVGFHPLLQRMDEENDHLRTAHSLPQLSADSSSTGFGPHQNAINNVPTNLHGHTGSTATNATPPSPDSRANELDLDFRLSFTAGEENNGENRHGSEEGMTRSTVATHEFGTAETLPSRSFQLSPKEQGIANEHDSSERSLCHRSNVNGSSDQWLPEIVMEQEELSDSEDEMAESVEFECEEMTDSEGEGGSDSDRIDNLQHEDVQHDSLPEVMVHEDSSDRDVPRCHHTCKADLISEKFGMSNPEKDKPSNSLGLSLNPYASQLPKSKLPVTRNRSSYANRPSKSRTPLQPQLDAATPAKKLRKQAQKLNPRRSNGQKPV